MTVAPTQLRLLGAYWTEHGGVNLGIVGDTAHRARPSYHNGQDAIEQYGRTAATDYSIRHVRDREPYLTDAAAAIDLGKLDGSLAGLQKFSVWLVQQCLYAAPGWRDVREIIYSPDGVTVQRWSGIDGQLHTGAGNGDSSHRWHTHISYFRDSENRDKVALFAPYWEDEDMGVDWYPLPGGDGTVKIKVGRGLVNLSTGKAVIPDDLEKTSHCRGHLVKSFGEGTGRQDGYVVRHAQQAHLALDDVVESFTPATNDVGGTSPTVLTGDDGSVYRKE